jgi:hypothetical protein
MEMFEAPPKIVEAFLTLALRIVQRRERLSKGVIR